MAQVRVDTGGVTVQLAWWERPFAGWRSRIGVPPGAVRDVAVVVRPTSAHATPGGRAGLRVAGLLKVGTWGIGTGRRQFVSVRRGRPALRVVLDPAAAPVGYDELLVGTPDAARLAAALLAAR